jgi:hypothetical protein
LDEPERSAIPPSNFDGFIEQCEDDGKMGKNFVSTGVGAEKYE